MEKAFIYLDDIRTPKQGPVEGVDWTVVRNYQEFVDAIKSIGLENIHIISLDHDLGDSAMSEYFNNVSPNFKLDYDNIKEKTGYDCAKFLVDYYYKHNSSRLEMDRFERRNIPVKFPTVYVHSANPIGSANIMGYINNFFMNEGQPQTCVRVHIDHTA
jgi:hypothetical protein